MIPTTKRELRETTNRDRTTDGSTNQHMPHTETQRERVGDNESYTLTATYTAETYTQTEPQTETENNER